MRAAVPLQATDRAGAEIYEALAVSQRGLFAVFDADKTLAMAATYNEIDSLPLLVTEIFQHQV